MCGKANSKTQAKHCGWLNSPSADEMRADRQFKANGAPRFATRSCGRQQGKSWDGFGREVRQLRKISSLSRRANDSSGFATWL